MTKSISSSLEAHIAQEVTTLATCWRLTRTDGVEYFFTDHDQPLTIDGNTYVASTGYNRTAIANNSSLAVDNLDVVGILDSDQITEEDLRAGRFDYAEIKLFLVNYDDLSQGILRVRRGHLGEVLVTREGLFRSELRGLTQAYSQRIGETYTPECRADLGDDRCKVPIQPDEIERETAYSVGDYVVVKPAASLRVPITNNGFEDGDLTGWTTVSGTPDVVESNVIDPFSGRYFLEGDSSFEISQTVDVTSLISTTDMDNGDYRFTFRGYRAQSGGDTDDTGRIVVEALDGGGAVLSTLLDTGDELLSASWRQRRVDNAALPVGTRQFKFRLIGTLVAGMVCNAAFDDLEAEMIQDAAQETYSLPISNASFETATLDGWALDSGVAAGVSGAEAHDGSWSFLGTSSTGFTYSQTLDLTTLPWFDSTLADNAGYTLDVSAWMLGQAVSTDTMRFRVQFLDSGGSAISDAYDSGVVQPSVFDWEEFGASAVSIPASTRQIKLELIGVDNDGSGVEYYVDDISMTITDTTWSDLWERFGNRMYQCTTAGTTAIYQPDYSRTVGAVIEDGTAEFTCEQSWMRHGYVNSVTDRRTFEAIIEDPRAVDDWFNLGVVYWETGDNAGRAIEIKDWDHYAGSTSSTSSTTTGTISGTVGSEMSLFLEMGYQIQVGDKFRVYPGCDKRLATCKDRFDNVVNFRGEPYVPGQDEYFNYPNAK